MTTLNETYVNSLKINRLTKTQLNNATELSPSEAYWEDPEFVGGKLLETTADGDIVESSQTIPTKTSDLSNDSGFITSSALSGYATETWVGQQGFLTSTALNGYATETWVGQQGYITGITSSDVTTALGFTPYDASNPNGYTSNTGTVTSVNNVSPVNGNVSLSIPTVNNSTITITQGGVTKGSFTLNQSTGDTIALDAGGGSVNTFNLFDYKWSDYQLNDQSWLRADTFSWQDGTVYSDAYNHLVDDYTNGTSTTETVGSYTITYVLADDGHKITTDETTVSNIYNESGVAWYYILDTANQRFKLPRENPAREELIQTIRAKGNGISLGITDGTNYGGLITTGYTSNTGRGNTTFPDAYGANIGSSLSWQDFGNRNTIAGITTDSTKSGIISDMTESTSVYKGKQYLYFYVGQFTQTATEQTAGLHTELFTGKVDLNLNNMNPSQTSKKTIDGWGMPDYDSGVSRSSSTDYTETTNGWIQIYTSCYNSSSQVAYLYINDVQYRLTSSGSGHFNPVYLFMPIPAGTKYKLVEGRSDSVHYFNYFPCKGG